MSEDHGNAPLSETRKTVDNSTERTGQRQMSREETRRNRNSVSEAGMSVRALSNPSSHLVSQYPFMVKQAQSARHGPPPELRNDAYYPSYHQSYQPPPQQASYHPLSSQQYHSPTQNGSGPSYSNYGQPPHRYSPLPSLLPPSHPRQSLQSLPSYSMHRDQQPATSFSQPHRHSQPTHQFSAHHAEQLLQQEQRYAQYLPSHTRPYSASHGASGSQSYGYGQYSVRAPQQYYESPSVYVPPTPLNQRERSASSSHRSVRPQQQALPDEAQEQSYQPISRPRTSTSSLPPIRSPVLPESSPPPAPIAIARPPPTKKVPKAKVVPKPKPKPAPKVKKIPPPKKGKGKREFVDSEEDEELAAELEATLKEAEEKEAAAKKGKGKRKFVDSEEDEELAAEEEAAEEEAEEKSPKLKKIPPPKKGKGRRKFVDSEEEDEELAAELEAAEKEVEEKGAVAKMTREKPPPTPKPAPPTPPVKKVKPKVPRPVGAREGTRSSLTDIVHAPPIIEVSRKKPGPIKRRGRPPKIGWAAFDQLKSGSEPPAVVPKSKPTPTGPKTFIWKSDSEEENSDLSELSSSDSEEDGSESSSDSEGYAEPNGKEERKAKSLADKAARKIARADFRNDPAKRFGCPHCDKRFARNFNLQSHIKSHTGIREFPCPEKDCTKAFSRRHDCARHLVSVHKYKSGGVGGAKARKRANLREFNS